MQIFLTGFMGSGKTTAGRLLAHQLGVPFSDSDEEIEKQTGKTVSELFSTEGEAAFRELEKKLIADLKPQNAVMACGGGLPVYNSLMDVLLVKGTVIYLETDADELYGRLVNESASRPLLPDNFRVSDITEKLALREAVYSKAHYTISTKGLSPEQTAGKIKACLKI